MNVKIEDLATNKIKNLQQNIEKSLDVVPVEHLRGFTKIVVVDMVNEPRLPQLQRASLPFLYHPKMPGQMAWAEIATGVLFPKQKFPKSLMARLSLKSTIAQVILTLVAQHYYLTFSKGIKKNQLDTACRQYVEKHFETWRERQGGLRVKLLKPFKPYLDRWAKKLAKRYREEMVKKGQK